MVFSNVIVDITISCCSFVFNQSRDKLTPLYTAPCLFSGLSLTLAFELLSSRRKAVIGRVCNVYS